MMKSKYRITVFTPTYNRAYIIEKLYDSLCKQTFRDFEWLVVDDGSVDDTEMLISKLRECSDFSIRYYKTSNGGKHRAINKGLELAEGEIFFTVDSDDELTIDALHKIDRWFDDIKDEKNVIGIAANKGTKIDETPNLFFEEEYIQDTFIAMNLYEKNGKKILAGERAIAFYTTFGRKYPFPEYEGEKFITEAVVYNRMARDGHEVRYYNDIIWIYEYREDGLTKAGANLFLNNPKGYGLWVKEKMEIEKWSSFRKLLRIYTFVSEFALTKSSKDISSYIGVPRFLIFVFKRINLIKRKIKKYK